MQLHWRACLTTGSGVFIIKILFEGGLLNGVIITIVIRVQLAATNLDIFTFMIPFKVSHIQLAKLVKTLLGVILYMREYKVYKIFLYLQ